MFRRRLRMTSMSVFFVGAALTAPAWAVSLSSLSDAQSLPRADMRAESLAASLTAGSSSLVPLMASEMQATHTSTINAPAAGGASVGKPLDDMSFVKVANENGRQEMNSARAALPRLKSPELKQIAEMLVNDHNNANAKLAQLAESKQWPLPGARAPAALPAGAASGDFDAKWTAEMIAGHEKSISLYRAQAANGEDKDLRRYAHDTLPTIEQHLSQLKNLQQ